MHSLHHLPPMFHLKVRNGWRKTDITIRRFIWKDIIVLLICVSLGQPGLDMKRRCWVTADWLSLALRLTFNCLWFGFYMSPITWFALIFIFNRMNHMREGSFLGGQGLYTNSKPLRRRRADCIHFEGGGEDSTNWKSGFAHRRQCTRASEQLKCSSWICKRGIFGLNKCDCSLRARNTSGS